MVDLTQSMTELSEVRQQIWEILQEPQLAVLATMTQDAKPWARYVLIKTDEQLTIRLASSSNARKIGQIELNPFVHLTCGVSDPDTPSPYLQIAGVAEISAAESDRKAFWEGRSEPFFPEPKEQDNVIICVTPYRIEHTNSRGSAAVVWKP